VSRHPGNREEFYETIKRLSRQCFVPLTVGGWVTSVEDMRRYLQIGADKIIVNTAAVKDPGLIERGSDQFGRQCIVVSIDARKAVDAHEVVIDRGRDPTDYTPSEWAESAVSHGAGEIFLTSIDQDGAKEGYDLDLVRSVTEAVDVPVVASGGAGEWEHLVEVFERADPNAASVANRFHHSQHSTTKAKEHLIEAGLDVREPVFADRWKA
jgi:cyclase